MRTVLPPLLLVCALTWSGCKAPVPCGQLAPQLDLELTTVDHENPKAGGFLLSFDDDPHALTYRGAVGAGLTPASTVRIASITKTFTAAAVLRLVEQGQLALDDTVGATVPEPLPTLLRGDGYDVDAMTVRHLLQHTAGLFDYAVDPGYQAAVFADPAHRWSRQEQVQWAVDHGAPLSAPGKAYHYADTGYVLLGAILEAKTHGDLAAALRTELDFQRLGLTSTWLESLEPAPADAGPRAPQSDLGVALASVDPSTDLWGGGGLVASLADVMTFYRALLGGQVFASPASLTTMLTIPATNTSDEAAMGIFRYPHGAQDCWGHTGYWGLIVVDCPTLGFSFAAAGMNTEQLGDGVSNLISRASADVETCK
jgi:D-alanyl-D-alanine carboxypeptidase